MKERMLAGEPYRSDDPQLEAERARAQVLQERYNAIPYADAATRDAVLRELLGSVGDGVLILPTFRCDYGYNVHVGAGTFINYDCVMLDPAPIRIGAHCQIATRVQLLTARHPIDAAARRSGWESAAPITLGDDVWLGGGVIVGPGVTIGDRTVVGGGAVVTRDLPPDVVATGVPARPMRAIGPDDRVELG